MCATRFTQVLPHLRLRAAMCLLLLGIVYPPRLLAQSYVDTTNAFGQTVSVLTGYYASSFWWNCSFVTVDPTECVGGPAPVPLLIEYADGTNPVDVRSGSFAVYDPNNTVDPFTYPFP